MKNLKNPLLLVLVWVISVFALCLSFMFYSKEMSHDFDLQKLVGGTFLFMIYSAFFSFPAFLFFIVVSLLTLRSKTLSTGKKKLIMVSANLFDILFTFGALFYLMMGDTLNTSNTKQIGDLANIFGFYPLWVLVGISCLSIILLPFNFTNTTKS